MRCFVIFVWCNNLGIGQMSGWNITFKVSLERCKRDNSYLSNSCQNDYTLAASPFRSHGCWSPSSLWTWTMLRYDSYCFFLVYEPIKRLLWLIETWAECISGGHHACCECRQWTNAVWWSTPWQTSERLFYAPFKEPGITCEDKRTVLINKKHITYSSQAYRTSISFICIKYT